MSGIAGLYRRDGQPVTAAEPWRMTAAMRRRGPDGFATWVEGPVGLGHCLLDVTAGESTAQPLSVDAGRGLALTAQARIDNRDELITLLGLAADACDERIILAAYEAWGQDCPARLVGDFAFALSDTRRRIVFCARDVFGVRPFYYHHDDRLFAFASQSSALLSLPEVQAELNEARIADFLVPGLEAFDATSAFYRSIRRLPPAHQLVAGRDGLRIRRYWRLDPEQRTRCADDTEYVEAFRERFRDAVTCRLRGVARPASMLSGGLDSSSIVGMASRVLGRSGRRPLIALSAVSNGADCAETLAARRVQRLPEVRSHELNLDTLGRLAPALARAFREIEEPFDAEMILVHAIYARARELGVRSLFDGVDGDYATSLEPGVLGLLLRQGDWRAAWDLAGDFSRFYRGTYRPWSSRSRLLAGNVVSACLPDGLRPPLRNLGGAIRASRWRYDSLRHEFAHRVGVRDRLRDLHAPHARAASSPTELQAWTLQHPNLTVALERYDRAAGLWSIEPQHPFVDRRLVEFCLGLPWEQKVAGGWTKSIVRRAMSGILPDEVAWRRGRWERLGPALAGAFLATPAAGLRQFVDRGLARVDSYVDGDEIRRCLGTFEASADPGAGETVWRAAVLARWLENRESATCLEASEDSSIRGASLTSNGGTTRWRTLTETATPTTEDPTRRPVSPSTVP